VSDQPDVSQQNELGALTPAVRAAEYVRMSTDHQRYSTENQADAIREYAARNNIEIVRTYADHGKSGLSIAGRDAMKQMLADVEGRTCDFSLILVYDVSRWGRFQDTDESAYYEYKCKKAGVRVIYCAEPFENDGSVASEIFKNIKRTMSREYSRELANKVFKGQCRLIELGFRQGGSAGFGLRRSLVDGGGMPKGELSRGEHKSIQTDRVVLTLGPVDEVETVREIYRSFVEDGRNEDAIARDLNERGILNDVGRPWSRGTVHQVLINEKYVGDNVWNRVSIKLHERRRRNARDEWIRRDGAFPAAVDRLLFDAAQVIIQERARKLTDHDMLEALRRVLATHGRLSGILIDEADDAPSSSAYSQRFTSLLKAYQLIGYTPERDFAFLAANRAARAMHPTVVAEIMAGVEHAGGKVTRDPDTDLLTVNDEFTAAVVLSRCRVAPSGTRRWLIRLDECLIPDITVAVRLEPGEAAALDYYLLPWIDLQLSSLRLRQANGFGLDAFRFDTLEPFFDLAARTPIRGMA
jgi:DNA invertase Pin-like site-specific DNA recombinase